MRGIIRIFGISWDQFYSLLNSHVLGLGTHRDSVSLAGKIDVLEYDELCSYVGKKKRKQWLWTAISRNTEQIIA